MVEPVSILSSRRSYEFQADEIKLSLLCIRGVVDAIKASFGFEYADITTPASSFGTVANTIPPGLVLALGVTPVPEGHGTAVRSIMIDSRRIVIDIPGPSSVIEPTFRRLKDLVADLRTPEGAPAIPDPHSQRDYSELVTHSPNLLNQLFNRSALQVISEAITLREDRPHELVGAARFRLQSVEEEYPGSSDVDSSNVNLDIRAGTKIDDGMVFSGAPLDSEAHLRLIDRLLEATTQGSS